MVVRFLPVPEDRPTPPREDRANLAEVIDFRSRLAPQDETAREPASPASVWASGPQPEPQQPQAAELSGRVETAPVATRKAAAVRLIDSVLNGAGDAEPESQELRAEREGRFRPEDDLGLDDDLGPELPVMSAAVKLLSRKAMSSGEVRRALIADGYPEFDAEDAVAECEDSLYLDDTDLARTITQKLRDSKGESRGRIRQKLRDRLLPDACIEDALAQLDEGEELDLLKQTAHDRARRMSGLDRQTAERRLMGFLARRGWSGEPASRAVREALDAQATGRSRGPGSSVRFS